MDTATLRKYSNDRSRYAVILVLSVIVSLVTIYCLVNGIQNVFPHMYYVPIILAAYWFQRNGVLYAAGMGLLYLGFVVLITGYNPNFVVAAACTLVAFIIIAAVVALLSMRISTEQREVEISEKKFHSIWEHIQAGIILIDAQSHEIIAANPEAERMTGYTEKEMIGHPCHKFICPSEKGQCPICDLKMTIDRSERVLLTKSGGSIPVLKTVKETVIGDRNILIENCVPLPVSGTPETKCE
jgi:PAS domain S-box-containing protein